MPEETRKCAKCGKSPAADNVKLFRWPKPGLRNNFRCTEWAKYLFPDEEEKYLSAFFQKKLYTEHKMLCQDHFSAADFLDDSKKKLLRLATPSDGTKGVCFTLPAYESQDCPRTIGICNPPAGICNPKDPIDKDYIRCQKYMRKVCMLRKKLKKLQNKDMLKELTDNNAAKKLSKKITPAFALQLQTELRNCGQKPARRRWSKNEKVTALRLYQRSPTCYRLLRRLFPLPSAGTLKALLSKVPLPVGFSQAVCQVVQSYTLTHRLSDNNFILMFDEMKIKRHLHYNIKEDLLEGFQDHGVNGRSPDVANYALVFMVVGIRKTVKQPIAYYYSSGHCASDRLAVIIKQVLTQCFEEGINISATVCDMDGANRKALSILGASMDHPQISVNDNEVVTLFDTPHLLKSFRNLFVKYDIECSTDISSGDKLGQGVAKWSHIKTFYEIDTCNPNFVFAPALTKDHLSPNLKQKMRVKLAAQALSHTVAVGLYAKASDGAMSPDAAVTAEVVANVDKLFDCLNSDTAHRRRGKPHSTNMTETSPHNDIFIKMKNFFQIMKFIGRSRTPHSQEGWIWTMTGVQKLFDNLKHLHGVRSLSTRRLQQDPLENLFGCIHSNCGSNTIPTAGQFLAGLKTAIFNSLPHTGTTGNCEKDNHVIINNFDSMLSVSQTTPTLPRDTQATVLIDSEMSLNIEEKSDDNAEIEACVYACSFLLKKILTTECEICRNAFVVSELQKTYSAHKQSVNYASQNFTDCVEDCATIINNFLKENGHLKHLKKTATRMLRHTVNFEFMNVCTLHGDQNVEITIDSVFLICVKRFCVVTNRSFSDEAKASALKSKLKKYLHY